VRPLGDPHTRIAAKITRSRKEVLYPLEDHLTPATKVVALRFQKLASDYPAAMEPRPDVSNGDPSARPSATVQLPSNVNSTGLTPVPLSREPRHTTSSVPWKGIRDRVRVVTVRPHWGEVSWGGVTQGSAPLHLGLSPCAALRQGRARDACPGGSVSTGTTADFRCAANQSQAPDHPCHRCYPWFRLPFPG